jgi:hypothetical protein
MTRTWLQVLVEYDGVEWHRREWISIYKESLFHLFLVEHSMVWTDRVDPLSPAGGPTILWPALVSNDTFNPANVHLRSSSSVETDNRNTCLRKCNYFMKHIPFVTKLISLWK